MKVKVEGHTNLVRDMKSGAIISTSRVEYMNYMKAVKLKEEEKQQTKNMCDELNKLKDEFAEIKNLLKQIIEK
mgnify:FL=1|tara:strand:- start:12770 stop:12988 length:219 start_codon:yes stop_codon:yes gene_type:complete